ncbi:OLC1v1037534C1 [Oldenlandia corymbosa var. corymbosa]|nr:OLC1v1037534C1 [Oldenlandia corymbosa var. corymbosa]
MKSYEKSVGDVLARLKGGKLPLPDVLRYGIELVKGIQELHSIGLLVLNLKPTNFLLNDQGKAVIGDFGIPYLLLGIPPVNSNFAFRLGTPNYMAPEQWEPELRGPLTCETDSWGFGCCVVEMLTGIPPWFRRSSAEIYHSTVINQEKPQLPSGVPAAVEHILNGCFEYDLRNRPLMQDIILAFERSLDSVSSDGEWIGFKSTLLLDKSIPSHTSWSLSKDHLQIGDTVRSRKIADSHAPQTMAVAEGTVVGLEKDSDQDGFVLVRIPNLQSPLRLKVSTLERVTSGLAAGDWVCLIEENNKHSPVGILHSIERDGNVSVGFLGLETLWKGHSSELRVTEPYIVGNFVRLKSSVTDPRFKWPQKGRDTWATGRVTQILPNGCLIVKFPGLLFIVGECPSFMADPAEVELVSFDTCPSLVEKYHHVEDFHWSVRPLAIAFGLFAAVQIGIFAGKNIGGKLNSKDRKIQLNNDKDEKIQLSNNDSRGQSVQVGSNTPRRKFFFKDTGPASITA